MIIQSVTLKRDRRAVVIGNFDGVHRGHQALLAKAKNLSPHVIVLTFEPHPRDLFTPDGPPFRITPPTQKNDLLRQFGAIEIITLPFTRDFAGMEANAFVEKIIRKQAKADFVLVGGDFHFGHKRSGTVKLLRDKAEANHYEFNVMPDVMDGAHRYASTRIREALTQGNIALANEQLGWRFNMTAEVVKGDQRGRTLGFPTANQRLNGRLPPAFGVYASVVTVDGKTYKGATNIGIRPMFESAEPLVETHILDFSGDLYGQQMTVEPVACLRGEAHYDSLDALIDQIGKDCAQARALLTSGHHDQRHSDA